MALRTPPSKRLSRPAAPPGARITERDAEVLRLVARFRFLSSDQITRCIGGSHSALLVRLKLLFWHGYLDRPRNQRVQLASFFDEGNRPLIYGLARKGARLLRELGVAVDANLDWTTKNARATATFLAHTLETAETMIAFDQACAMGGSAHLVDHHALLAFMPAETRALRDPFRCRVTVRLDAQAVPIAVVPDRLFSFVYPNGTRHNFALELDRGTMDVQAKRLAGKSSFRRKLIGYFHVWRERKHTQAWGFQGFRVLTVTTSEKRIARMIEAQRAVTNGAAPGLFLYSTMAAIAQHGATAAVWLNGANETVTLTA